MSEFYFIRHGQTDWNLRGLMQGATDIPLNNTGREQARAAQHFIEQAGITRIISSPLSRAFETAQILNEHANLPIDTVDGLAERSFGIYEGRERHHAPQIDGRIADGLPHEEIESYAAVAVRANHAIETALTTHSNERLLFVAHGGVFSSLHNHYTGTHKGCDNAVPYHFLKRDAGWTIAGINLSVLQPTG